MALAGIIPCLILSTIILRSYESRAVSIRTSTVRNQCTVLANHLINYGYLEDTSIATVNAELEQLSSLYDGRVLIMNADYRVIKDTYGISEGKYMISEEVVKTFGRETVSRYDDENNYIEVTTPLVINEGASVGNHEIDGSQDEKVVGVMLTSVSTEEIRETISMLWKRAHFIVISVVVIILFLSYFLSRRMVRPLNEISKSIDAIQEGFDHSEISVAGYSETENVTTAFNHLLGRMKALDDSRQEFVSNVSHELKTPITSVKVLADSLLQQGDDVPASVYREFMEDIVHEIDRENDIINDLLALVKMDKKGATLNLEECDMEELIASIVKRLEPLANQAGISMVFETVRDVVADVDKTKMSLAITNLIENGIKYNNPGGSVFIKLDAEPMMFKLDITDTGIGIPEEDIHNIFERFYRVDKSHSREIGGNGLGLAITRNVILMHKGAIKVDSVLGEGTTFSVKIPLSYIREHKPENMEAKNAEPEVIEENINISKVDISEAEDNIVPVEESIAATEDNIVPVEESISAAEENIVSVEENIEIREEGIETSGIVETAEEKSEVAGERSEVPKEEIEGAEEKHEIIDDADLIVSSDDVDEIIVPGMLLHNIIGNDEK